MTKEKGTELPDIKVVETQGGLFEPIDLSEFDKKVAKIEGYEIIDTNSRWDKDGNELPPGVERPIKKLKVYTEVLKEIEKSDGSGVIQIRGVEFMNLKETDDGEFVISLNKTGEGNKSDIQKLMEYLKIESYDPKEMKGKEVVLKLITRKRDGMQFLGFYRD